MPITIDFQNRRPSIKTAISHLFASTNMSACLIRLDRRPAAGQFCVTLSGISPNTDPAKLERCLRECGGPLENLIVHESHFGESRALYATAQFFCEADCERCRSNCDGLLLSGRRIQVSRLTKSSGWSSNGAVLELGFAKAIELMNHFLGFNGWSSELLGFEAVANGSGTSAGTSTAVLAAAGYEARVRIRVPGSGVDLIGTGVGDTGSVVGLGSGAAGFEVAARRKKTAVSNAVKAVLARLVLVLLPSGKVLVRVVEAPQKEQARVVLEARGDAREEARGEARGLLEARGHAQGETRGLMAPRDRVPLAVAPLAAAPAAARASGRTAFPEVVD